MERKSRKGVRCNECQQQWTRKSSYYKKLVQNWGETLSAVERCLNAPYLSDADGSFMKKCCNQVSKFLKVKDHNNDLKELIKLRYEFYKTAKVR